VSAFDDDFAAADEMFAEAFGVEVDYLVAGVVIAAGQTAEVSLQQYKTADSFGALQTIVSRDYTFLAADIGREPESGHRIQETLGGVLKTFEVMPIEGGPCWQPIDADNRRIVVHTKEVA
jgi:hypothetical protein